MPGIFPVSKYDSEPFTQPTPGNVWLIVYKWENVSTQQGLAFNPPPRPTGRPGLPGEEAKAMQVKTNQVTTNQIKPGQTKSNKAKADQNRTGHTMPGQTSLDKTSTNPI